MGLESDVVELLTQIGQLRYEIPQHQSNLVYHTLKVDVEGRGRYCIEPLTDRETLASFSKTTSHERRGLLQPTTHGDSPYLFPFIWQKVFPFDVALFVLMNLFSHS